MAKQKTPQKKVSPKKTAKSGGGVAYVKAESVISRRNQNGTVILMRMDRASLFFRLDGIAAEVWECLFSPNTLEEIERFFVKRYPKRSKTIRQLIESLIKRLTELELVATTKAPARPSFPDLGGETKKVTAFGEVKEFDLEQIESEVLNESVYLDVFAGSDLKLKVDISPIRDALGKVLRLDGVTYRWNPEVVPSHIAGKAKGIRSGLIAQQVAAEMPELVRADTRTGHLAVEYRKLNAYLVEAIKDLNRMISVQNERIRKLEKRRAASA